MKLADIAVEDVEEFKLLYFLEKGEAPPERGVLKTTTIKLIKGKELPSSNDEEESEDESDECPNCGGERYDCGCEEDEEEEDEEGGGYVAPPVVARSVNKTKQYLYPLNGNFNNVEDEHGDYLMDSNGNYRKILIIDGRNQKYALRLSELENLKDYYDRRVSFGSRKRLENLDCEPYIVFSNAKIEPYLGKEEASKLTFITGGHWAYLKDNIYITNANIKYNTFIPFSEQVFTPLSEENTLRSWAKVLTKGLTDKCSGLEQTIIRLRTQLHDAQRDYGMTKVVVDSFMSPDNKILHETVEKMRTVKNIEKITFHETGVVAKTIPVNLKYGEVEYYIGQYEIVLDFKTGIKFRNLYQLKGKAIVHPRGRNYGEICLGGYSNLLGTCYANFDYVSALETVLDYIFHPSDGDDIHDYSNSYGKKKVADSAYQRSKLVTFFNAG